MNTALQPKPRRARKVAAGGAKVWAWISSRRTARAIASNRAMVTALAATVGVAGVGAYSVHQAAETRSQIASLNTRVAALDAGLSMATARIANVKTDLAHLATKEGKTAGALGALRVRLTAMGESMAGLKNSVAGMPAAGARTEDLARKVSALAAEARDTAQLAADAASAVALDDNADAYARQTAAEATAAATKAQQAANAAQAKADAAAELAARPDPTIPPIPPFEFPRVIDYPTINTTVTTGPVSRTVSADLPRGNYRATLTAGIDTGSDKAWYVDFTAAGQPKQRVTGANSDTVQVPVEFVTGGGVSPFGFAFDVYVAGTNVPVTVTAHLTLEQLDGNS